MGVVQRLRCRRVLYVSTFPVKRNTVLHAVLGVLASFVRFEAVHVDVVDWVVSLV